MTPRELRWATINAAILPVIVLGSIPVAYLVSPSRAQHLWILLVFAYAAAGRLERRGAAASR